MESIMHECELHGVDTSSVSKLLPCSPSEASQLNIEKVLTKKLESLKVSERLKENENLTLEKTMELEKVQIALQNCRLEILDNSVAVNIDQLCCADEAVGVNTTHMASGDVGNFTEAQKVDAPFESLAHLSGTLLDLSLPPCSTNVITGSSANSAEEKICTSDPTSMITTNPVNLEKSTRNSILKRKNDSSTKSANESKRKRVRFENCTTGSRDTASAQSLRSRSTAKKVRCSHSQSPQRSGKRHSPKNQFEVLLNLERSETPRLRGRESVEAPITFNTCCCWL